MPQGKPRDPHKERHWRQLIEQWQRSGLTVGAFCQCHRLAVSSFYAWRRTIVQRDRLTLPSPTPEPVTFLPVHVRHDEAPTQPPLDLVLADGRCLRIPHGFDPAHLRRVLRALEDSPC